MVGQRSYSQHISERILVNAVSWSESDIHLASRDDQAKNRYPDEFQSSDSEMHNWGVIP